MTLLIVVLIIVLLLGGGFGFRRYGAPGLGGALGLVILLLIIFWIVGPVGRF